MGDGSTGPGRAGQESEGTGPEGSEGRGERLGTAEGRRRGRDPPGDQQGDGEEAGEPKREGLEREVLWVGGNGAEFPWVRHDPLWLPMPPGSEYLLLTSPTPSCLG